MLTRSAGWPERTMLYSEAIFVLQSSDWIMRWELGYFAVVLFQD